MLLVGSPPRPNCAGFQNPFNTQAQSRPRLDYTCILKGIKRQQAKSGIKSNPRLSITPIILRKLGTDQQFRITDRNHVTFKVLGRLVDVIVKALVRVFYLIYPGRVGEIVHEAEPSVLSPTRPEASTDKSDRTRQTPCFNCFVRAACKRRIVLCSCVTLEGLSTEEEKENNSPPKKPTSFLDLKEETCSIVC